jgi:cytochrome P450
MVAVAIHPATTIARCAVQAIAQSRYRPGFHYCLGARLARLEARVVLEELLSRVGKICVAGPVGWTGNPTVRGPSSLLFDLEA